MKIAKIIIDAEYHGYTYFRDNPGIDCSQPNPAGGWTDAVINAIGSSDLRTEYGIRNEDEWSDFLSIYETNAQKAWLEEKKFAENN